MSEVACFSVFIYTESTIAIQTANTGEFTEQRSLDRTLSSLGSYRIFNHHIKLALRRITQQANKKRGRELPLDPLDIVYEDLRVHGELNTTWLLSFPLRYGQT